MSTEPEEIPEGVQLERGLAELAEAARQLREVSVAPVEVADRVLQRTLAAPRPAQLVRVPAPHEFLTVSTVALTALLRAGVDPWLQGAALGRVVIDVDRDGRLVSVLLELIVQYGNAVAVQADHARALARGVLAEAFGSAGSDVVVHLTHVHVSDVTRGDPRVVDPADER